MKRLLPVIAVAALAGAAASSGTVSASADDQAAADAAIAAFNERLTEAGGESSGPPDTEPVDEEEYVAENPGSECFGEFATGLDPGGSVEGQTARANSDHFTFQATDDEATGTDEVDAGVITVDSDHAQSVHDFVVLLGSNDLVSCIDDAYATLLAEQAAAAAESSGSTVAPEEVGTVETSAESDLGIGETSSHTRITISYVIEDVPYSYNLNVYAAAVDRTIVIVTLSTEAEGVSDFDPEAELAALVDSL